MNRIFYSKPSITELEISYVSDAIANGWGEHCYDYITRFESTFREYVGSKYAIATSSCTGALHMGLSALGVGPGDEVIIADINWIASVAPIVYLGAKPVFVDILPDTWCIDPASAEKAITERTKAIIAVHLYGNTCDMQSLKELATRYRLALVEDAAEAIGSRWRGRAAGSIGTFGAFSFHGTKTITTGEGGMFVTEDPDLYQRVLTLSNHGRAAGESRQFWASAIGYKYKISNIDAALGCAQLSRVRHLVEAKRRIFLEYSAHLRDLPVKLNPEPPSTVNGYWMPTFVVDPGIDFDRNKLLADFKHANIDGRVFFWPLSSLPMFEPTASTPVSYSLHLRACNLPSYFDMTSDDTRRVCNIVRQQFT